MRPLLILNLSEELLTLRYGDVEMAPCTPHRIWYAEASLLKWLPSLPDLNPLG